MRQKKKRRSAILFFIDYKLFLPIIILIIIGILAIADVSAPKAMQTFSDRFYFVKQQLMWILIGFFIYLIFSQVAVKLWNKYALHIYILSVVLLLLVFIPGIGIETLGAKRWINLGFTSFQPSEFAKLAICIYLAKIYSSKKKLIAYLFPLCVTSFLILLQPDFGTTVVIAMVSFILIFLSNIPFKKILAISLVGILLAFALIYTSNYRKERVISFVSPFSQNNESNYHIKQILYALAMGGVGGTGIGQSKQKYLFLPEATTDSIFAVLAEEVGFIGVGLIIFLYFAVSYRMMNSLKYIQDPFSYALSVGIFGWFTSQAFINLGSISSLIPFTGVPLPFISYGGSTLISLFAAVGMFNSTIKYSNYYEK
jgi:cell division protein FtsW